MEYTTKGVQNLLGDPKQAIRKISLPMMMGMLVQSIYNVVDGFWVAGLGTDSLAAIGLFFPFFMLIMAIGTGVGVGGSSAISRKIGNHNRAEAGNIATHTIVIGLVIGIILGIIILPFNEYIFTSLAGEKVGILASEYAMVLFAGAFIIIFSHIGNGILGGEGDTKRAMYSLVIGSCLNMVLDPIYIYVFNFGIQGAALSTITSMMVSSSLFVYWLMIKKDTYVDVNFKRFQFNIDTIKNIFSVGIPSSISQILMSITVIFMNILIMGIGGSDGIAVLTSGWRIIMLGIIPVAGLSTGVTAVTGAAFGAGDKAKLKSAYYYALKISVGIGSIVCIIVMIITPQISAIFTYSEGGTYIFSELVEFLRIMCLFYPTVPLAILTGAMFRGVKKGFQSLAITVLRNIVFLLPLIYLFGIVLDMGLTGVWIGMLTGNFIAVITAVIWGKITIDRI